MFLSSSIHIGQHRQRNSDWTGKAILTLKMVSDDDVSVYFEVLHQGNSQDVGLECESMNRFLGVLIKK